MLIESIDPSSFVGEVAGFYTSLGYEVEITPKNDHAPARLFVQMRFAGTTQSAIIHCPENWSDGSFPQFAPASRDSPGIDEIIVTPGKLVIETTAEFDPIKIRVLSYAELINEAIGLETYVRMLMAKCERWRDKNWQGQDRFVPPDVLVPGEIGRRPAFARIKTWLREPPPGMLVVLGSAGSGKTTLLHYIAYEMAREHLRDPAHHPAPILIRFGEAHRSVTLETILDGHFRICGLPAPAFSQLDYLARRGRIVILFDAYEEMSDGAAASFTKTNFEEMRRQVDRGWKVICTWRTESCIDFLRRSLRSGRSGELGKPWELLREWTEGLPNTSCLQLPEFTSTQTQCFLTRVRPDISSDDWNELIQSRDLTDLARHPIFLNLMMNHLPAPLLATDQNVIELYASFVQAWIQREEQRGRLQDYSNLLPLVSDLAWWIWLMDKDSVSTRQLPPLLERLLEERRLSRRTDQIAAIARQLYSTVFFTLDAEGNLSFIHSSVRDYFIACKLYDVLLRANRDGDKVRETRRLLKQKQLTIRSIRFLGMLDRQCRIYPPLQKLLQDPYEKNVSENSLLILYTTARAGCDSMAELKDIHAVMKAAIPPHAQLSGAQLQGISLHSAALRDANFAGADLSDAIFDDADLRSANFENANLSGASFLKARLDRARGLPHSSGNPSD